ncbi:hypothetical protein [Candidatus Pelagibacter sp. Uisw_130]|uniref:hypothetical protein n=1 Tax=Candidatus Pelagibacter sp. Uisw_130 TaxID=3230989 RepID=UPI0039EA0811
MNRFTLYLFGFLLLAQANAFALNCDLSKFKLGKDISNFEKEKIAFMLGEPVKGIKSITIPIEFVCQDKGIKGTIISLFFIDEKVVRIIFQNQVIQNRSLFKLANSFYKSGFKKNQKIIDANEPEQYAIEKNEVYYLYANLRGINENTGNFLELFEIVDKKHEDAANKEAIIEEEK